MNTIRTLTLALILSALAGCKWVDDSTRPQSNPTQLPHPTLAKAKPAKLTWSAADEKKLENAETCMHLAGEFGGDGTEHDREVVQAQEALSCDKAVDTLHAFKARLPKSSAQMARVTEALSMVE